MGRIVTFKFVLTCELWLYKSTCNQLREQFRFQLRENFNSDQFWNTYRNYVSNLHRDNGRGVKKEDIILAFMCCW